MAGVFKKCRDCGEMCEMGKNGTWQPRGIFRIEVPVCDKCANVTRDNKGNYWTPEGRANGQEYVEYIQWESVK